MTDAWRPSPQEVLALVELQMAQVSTAESVRSLELLKKRAQDAIERGDTEMVIDADFFKTD